MANSRAARAFFAAMSVGVVLASCSTIARAPSKAEIAELVRIDLTCRADEGNVCPPAEQPKKVTVDDVRCTSLPLRAGVAEVSRAECSYEARLVRADGNEKLLGRRTSEFGLLNYSPGARVGVYQWSKKPDRDKPLTNAVPPEK